MLDKYSFLVSSLVMARPSVNDAIERRRQKRNAAKHNTKLHADCNLMLTKKNHRRIKSLAANHDISLKVMTDRFFRVYLDDAENKDWSNDIKSNSTTQTEGGTQEVTEGASSLDSQEEANQG
tara:strand:+ start:983 stop:1348 length:366 start_codon:yes stop_codon:yes gene_type:complete